jgi:Zn-dependent protease
MGSGTIFLKMVPDPICVIETIFQIIILIMSVVVHEVAHGFAAYRLGDPTAKNLGRLTLNPIKHLDPFGSIIFPGLLLLANSGIVFGWAKPVPFNPYNLKNQKWGEAIVALAGPASNILLALVFGLFIRFGMNLSFVDDSMLQIASLIVFINLLLAIFNLVPIPPLDGSKILFSLLPYRFKYIRDFLERYGFFLVIFFIIFLWQFLYPLVSLLFVLITGLGL